MIATGGEGNGRAEACEPPHAQCSEHRMLAQVVKQTDDVVLITDASGIIEYVNPAFVRTSGYAVEEVLGKRPGFLRSDRHPPEFYRRLWETLTGGGVFRAVFANRRQNGQIYYEEKTISPMRGTDGRITHFVSTGKDVTSRIEDAERLERLANYDSLTGLPNRTLFMDRLGHALRRAVRNRIGTALLFLDLDRFKKINDTLGHGVGDAVLRDTAERLCRCVRGSDTVARLGGDEFTIILEDVEVPRGVERVAREILAALSAPRTIDAHTLFVTASIGIAICPKDGESADELLRRADRSMYLAKGGGRGDYRFHDGASDASALHDLAVETALREAADKGEFYVEYQPIVDVGCGRLVALEALLRWRSAELGLVAPDRFVPLLDDMGLIGAVSQWALREAASEVARLQSEYPGLRLSFNMSSRAFRDESLLQTIESVLCKSGLHPTLLELEITEGALMDNTPATGALLKALSRKGIGLAIDDFGTGYSSLSYLMRFPVRALKIDRSFVSRLEQSADARIIVRAVVSLALSLGLDAIAEGVETREQLEALYRLGCRRMQGFLIARPLCPSALAALRYPALDREAGGR